MKPSLLFLLVLSLAGCGQQSNDKNLAAAKLASAYTPPSLDSIKSVVSSHIKKSLRQPDSYQPTHWGQIRAWQEQDADSIGAEMAQAKAQIFRAMLAKERHLLRYADITPAHAAKIEANLRAGEHVVRLLEHDRDSLAKSTDTTRLGSSIYHAYRTRNESGGLTLDSGQFIVFKSGHVAQLGRISDDYKRTYSPAVGHSLSAQQCLR